MQDRQEAGVFNPRLLSLFPVTPAVEAGTMLENMRSAMGRGLPEVLRCRRHDKPMAIVGGGPSLVDTYKELSGYTVAINGSLGFLLNHDIVPYACALLDPRAHIADLVEKNRDVMYFVASTCHPSVFDKLKTCLVTLWHPSGIPGSEEILRARDADWLQIGGGSTMGLRCLNLGYVLGFREFAMHGVDSSFRGDGTHAYSDYRDGKPVIEALGYKTRLEFIAQVADFLAVLDRFSQGDVDPVKIEIHGDGLLPHVWKQYRQRFPLAFQ